MFFFCTTSEWEEQETDIQGDIIHPSGSSLPLGHQLGMGNMTRVELMLNAATHTTESVLTY
jgi:hypothetical protein